MPPIGWGGGGRVDIMHTLPPRPLARRGIPAWLRAVQSSSYLLGLVVIAEESEARVLIVHHEHRTPVSYTLY